MPLKVSQFYKLIVTPIEVEYKLSFSWFRIHVNDSITLIIQVNEFYMRYSLETNFICQVNVILNLILLKQRDRSSMSEFNR